MEKPAATRLITIVILIAVALLSFFWAGQLASDPARFDHTLTAIDDQVETVLKLTATSTIASAGVSAIPGDTATPIAEKLADFTEYFLLILCVLYAEKYLLAIIGAAAFKILIPVACLILIISLFWNPGVMRRLAFRLAILGLALFVTIPLSIRVSDRIYATYESSIDETIQSVEDFRSDTEGLTETSDEGLLNSIINHISNGATGLANRAAEILNNYVEALAVMIVTSCVIPIVVLIFFLWLIKILTGIQIAVPMPRKPGSHKI